MFVNDIQLHWIKKELNAFEVDDLSGDDISSVVLQGRRFELVRKLDGTFFPYECFPTGGISIDADTKDQWTVTHAWADALVAAYLASPNGFTAFLKSVDIEPARVIIAEPSFGLDTITYPTKGEAIEQIVDALRSDNVLKSWLTKTEMNAEKANTDMISEELTRLEIELSYWQDSMLPDHEELSLFYSAPIAEGDGGELPADIRNGIIDYLNAPSLSKWETIRTFSVLRQRRVWQILIWYDPTTPRVASGFTKDNIPEPKTLADALSKAVELHNKDCERKIAKVADELKVIRAMAG